VKAKTSRSTNADRALMSSLYRPNQPAPGNGSHPGAPDAAYVQRGTPKGRDDLQEAALAVGAGDEV
jgi:hypothetical protein